jgi:phosphoesterase RecJ-like protein
MRRATGLVGTGDFKLANFLITADDVDAAAVFVERDDGRVEVSLRAAPGFDVTPVALQFGGGGHTLAAGCNIPGPLEEAQDRVLAVLRAEIARQREERKRSLTRNVLTATNG